MMHNMCMKETSPHSLTHDRPPIHLSTQTLLRPAAANHTVGQMDAQRKMSTGFRKIDIDQYGDDVFKEEELNSLEPQSPAGVDEQEVKRLLQSGRKGEALRSILSSAPIHTKNQQAKDRAADLMMQVLMATKTSEIEAAIEKLEPELADILMKYIYRGFESPSEGSSAHLLTWHEKVFAIAGVGSIVRVLTDKKKV